MFRLFNLDQPSIKKYSFDYLIEYLEGKISLSESNIEQIIKNNLCGQTSDEIVMKFKTIITNYMADKSFYSDEEMDLSECCIGFLNVNDLTKVVAIINLCKPKHLDLSYNCLEDLPEEEMQILSDALISLSLKSLTSSHWEAAQFSNNQFEYFCKILGSGIRKLNLIPHREYSIPVDDLNIYENLVKMNQGSADFSAPRPR